MARTNLMFLGSLKFNSLSKLVDSQLFSFRPVRFIACSVQFSISFSFFFFVCIQVWWPIRAIEFFHIFSTFFLVEQCFSVFFSFCLMFFFTFLFLLLFFL